MPFGKLQFYIMCLTKRLWELILELPAFLGTHKLISTVLSLLKIFLELFRDCHWGQFTYSTSPKKACVLPQIVLDQTTKDLAPTWKVSLSAKGTTTEVGAVWLCGWLVPMPWPDSSVIVLAKHKLEESNHYKKPFCINSVEKIRSMVFKPLKKNAQSFLWMESYTEAQYAEQRKAE